MDRNRLFFSMKKRKRKMMILRLPLGIFFLSFLLLMFKTGKWSRFGHSRFTSHSFLLFALRLLSTDKPRAAELESDNVRTNFPSRQQKYKTVEPMILPISVFFRAQPKRNSPPILIF